MARSPALHTPDPTEIGEMNPLDNYDYETPETAILNVSLSTSSSTLSISNPDPDFHLILSVSAFQCSQPNTPLTISTGRSVLDMSSHIRGAFRLVCEADEEKSLVLSISTQPRYIYEPTEKKNLKKIRWLKFITIPASGTLQIEHPLPLERMLCDNHGVERGDLKPGTKYRVWMKQEFLSIRYAYWGDLDGDLKKKKLSDLFSRETQEFSQIEEIERKALESKGWVFSQYPVEVRGNVGRHGPEFELVE